jgi:predicted CXXCH cytochrome family protein
MAKFDFRSKGALLSVSAIALLASANAFAQTSGTSTTTGSVAGTGTGTVTYSGGYTAGGFTSGTSITQTKHNLSSAGLSTQANSFSGTTEVCVFCHTPHGADSSASVPLWNRQLNHGQTYATYDQLGTSTLQGSVLTVGSVSLACLSCHDGTQAMNTMINQPGSGWGNTTAMNNGGWSGTAGPTGATMAGTWTGCGQLGAGCDPTDVVWIGTDLTNDHPVGIEYCGGGLSGTGTTVNGTCSNPDFKMPLTKSVNGKQIFWVDNAKGGTAGARDKTDMMLYTRDFSGKTNAMGVVGGTAEPSVECASCHDPHTAAQPTFLRVSNSGSGVCLSCHVK